MHGYKLTFRIEGCRIVGCRNRLGGVTRTCKGKTPTCSRGAGGGKRQEFCGKVVERFDWHFISAFSLG